MKNYNILIVEDIDTQRLSIDDNIREINVDSEVKIVPNYAENLQQALKDLNTSNYHAAVIDLKLRGDTDIAEGNEIIKEVIKKLRIPIFVYSDNLEMLDEKIKANDVIRLVKRAEVQFTDVAKDILNILNTDISEMFANNGIISTLINDFTQQLFWDYISHSWFTLYNNVSDKNLREKIIVRYLGQLLNEKLKTTEYGYEKAEPAEMYYFPPMKSSHYNGDIVEKDGRYYLIINAACDMELRRNPPDIKRDVDNIIMIKLIPTSDISAFQNYLQSQSNTNKDKVRTYILNKKARYHYLPKYGELPGFIADFEDIENSPVNQISNYKQIASVTEPFLKNIIYRFSSFYARPGQPDFDETKLLAAL